MGNFCTVVVSAVFLLFLPLLTPKLAEARLLQIIHTNDLHSHLEHATDPGTGGYAAVKATIDRIRDAAAANGIESLVLDGGDFTEGSKFYLAARGEATWRTMDAMGYDAVVIGNHDWLLGPADLDRVVGIVRPSFHLLGANFIFSGQRQNLARYMRPSAELRRAGLRIAVLGLTTDEFVFNWRADEGFIANPLWEANERIPALRARNDLVIALTHLGLKVDKGLVIQTSGLDLVVGAHSHSVLREPAWVKDRAGRSVPIVQAGEHGQAVGDLLVDVEAGQPVRILRYQLWPVKTDGPRDAGIEALVQHARLQLEAEYGGTWLKEVVGQSEVPLVKQTAGPTAWSQLVADAIREGGHADISLDVPQFTGINQPAGPITRETIVTLYPRMFDFDHRLGWTVWTSKVSGFLLKIALKQALSRDVQFGTSGVTWDEKIKKGKKKISNLRIGGKKIHWWKYYRVAMPEGVGRGAIEISDALRAIFPGMKDTGVPIWSAIEDRVRRIGVIR